MVDNKFIMEHLAEFHNIIDDLDNIKARIDEEDKILLLLNSLPDPLSTLGCPSL